MQVLKIETNGMCSFSSCTGQKAVRFTVQANCKCLLVAIDLATTRLETALPCCNSTHFYVFPSVSILGLGDFSSLFQ